VQVATIVALLAVAVVAIRLGWSADAHEAEDQRGPGAGESLESAPGADPEGDVVFRDDFDRDELGRWWGPYEGQPGGDPHSWWEPEQVSLRDGRLVLTANERDGRWVTGGVSNASVAQTYGRWDVRFRADAADEITVHFLLWPLSEKWPPEIDFFENFGGSRDSALAFLHWLENGERRQTSRDLSGVDFTEWHTVAVEWRPGRVDFLLDGEVWDTISGDQVPDEPMWLGLQTQAGGCERAAEQGFEFCPDVGTPEGAEVEIDWVEVRR